VTVERFQAIPIFRIFDIDKARDFYAGFLGMAVDWEHRFDDTAPVYMQVSRGELKLHLSEHHGDGCPGSTVYVQTAGLEDFHRDIASKGYRFMRPGIEPAPWGGKIMEVIDPFGNRLRFCGD
jgi:catechol 2,3-dioxygenase-like lactoylglutathione lyase family enzyme